MFSDTYIEIVGLAIILIIILRVNGKFNGNQFFLDNKDVLLKLKEKDYDFYLRAKYGDDVDSDTLFSKRLKTGGLVAGMIMLFLIKNLNSVNILIAVAAGFGIFKLQYMNLKTYYKNHLHQIDVMLPYYLKNLEILVQHYTVPVALGKSINGSPPIFKEGLQKLITRINEGDSTITPYMDFAKEYPVKDSMRMMRLLYRLSLGDQEGKQDRLLSFSRSISALQSKARETRYKGRLDKMESKTMVMLTATGAGVMVLLVMAILRMFSSM